MNIGLSTFINVCLCSFIYLFFYTYKMLFRLYFEFCYLFLISVCLFGSNYFFGFIIQRNLYSNFFKKQEVGRTDGLCQVLYEDENPLVFIRGGGLGANSMADPGTEAQSIMANMLCIEYNNSDLFIVAWRGSRR